jgi:hypothetical protein
MMIEIYRDFLRHLAKRANVSVDSAGEPEAAKLKNCSDSLPVDFYSVMTTCWPSGAVSAGPYELFSLEEIFAHRRFDALRSKGWFLIGHALNGDYLVIKTGNKWASETRVGLVSHGHFLEEQMHPDECSVDVAENLLEFFYRAVEDRYMPADFFCAQEFLKLKQKYGPEQPPVGA